MYKVIKVLNNNCILASEENHEVILLFKGLGFQKKPGMLFEAPRNTKKYLMQSTNRSRNSKEIVNNINPLLLEVASEIIRLAKEKFGEISHDILLPLADHIDFAVKRMDQGIMPQNPFKNDIKLLFPDEYKVALKGKDIIKQMINKDINDDEVSFITLHIHSAISTNHVTKTMEATRVIHDSIVQMENDLKIEIDKQSISYTRFMNHIKFLLLRLNTNDKQQVDISEFTKEKFPFAFHQAKQIALKLSPILESPLPNIEIGYLALHLERILSNINNK